MADLFRLFRQEMRGLQDEGANFAKDFPEAARYLDVDRIEDRDPYVERITEGLAFLTARIRELDHARQDGLTRHLLEVVAPDLESPLPSVAIVEFAPRSDTFETLLPRGSNVLAACRDGSADIGFVLTNSVPIDRVMVRAARADEYDEKSGILDLELARSNAADSDPWPDTIEFFLLADPPVVWSLRYALLRKLLSIEVEQDGTLVGLGGLEVARGATPAYVTGSMEPSPLEHMRDFLCADERFRTFRLRGLGALPNGGGRLKLRFRFQGTLPRGMARAVAADVFRLHAGVVVNRLLETCQAMAWDHTADTMALRPIGGGRREILDVVSVEGATSGAASRRIAFRKFSSYRQAGGDGHFQVIHRTSNDGSRLAELALGTNSGLSPLECQYVSVQAFCSDGDRPNEVVQPSDFHGTGGDGSVRANIVGLTRPTPSHRPAPKVDPKSRLLAMAAGHFDGWLDATRLKDGLRQLMWDSAESKRTLIEAIQNVSVENDNVLYNGVGWRRMVATVRLRDTTCTPETWDRLGILDAFGEGLYRFVMNETPIGARSKLRLVVEPAGVVMEWEN